MMMNALRFRVLVCSLFCVASAVAAPPQLRLPADFRTGELRPVAPASERSGIRALEACHIGGHRLLFRIPWREPGEPRGFHLYLDLDDDPETGRPDEPHRGVDLMLLYRDGELRPTHRNPDFPPASTFARLAVEEDAAWLLLFAPVSQDGPDIPIGVYLSGATEPVRVELARSEREKPEAVPPSYRYRANRVALESRETQGLVYEMVAPPDPFVPPRERPEVPFHATGRKPDAAGSATRERVSVSIREEAGTDRSQAPVSFGFPLPKGALFDPDRIRVQDAFGADVDAQVTVTSFWPDDSLRWVLLDWTQRFEANEERVFVVEFGQDVTVRSDRPPMQAVEQDGTLVVDTGAAVFRVNADRFAGLAAYRPGEAEPVMRMSAAVLTDDRGRVFSTDHVQAQRIAVEEQGPRKLVLRIEGPYADAGGETHMRHITRLIFRAGSGRITVAHTHINDVLDTEFTDIASLILPFEVEGGVRTATVYEAGEDGRLDARTGSAVRLFQADDASGLGYAGETRLAAGRLPGLLRVETQAGRRIQAVHHEFWQRWPKAVEAGGSGFAIELLPPQPGPEYGRDLPHYLKFPFVDGFYRFKWGMSFTERMTLDVLGAATPEELRADADLPPVAVIPAHAYARSDALGRMTAADEPLFEAWDRFFERGYKAQVARRERQREYGFFNYGDWFGERGRNWGNNEYDTAHVFFMQFARTGDTRYHRLALAAARHQADVDIVHAYPDPYYIGANHQHSIGHTGEWSQRPDYATWSFKYNVHTGAAGGHTWAEGLAQAWYLTGDARVMEAGLSLAEHITWAMSPEFRMSPSAPRSAGWALRAILALYRAAADPAYLEAAGRIAAEAIRTLDERGLWLRNWPEGEPGVSNFQQGATMAALSEYHAETGDPEVEAALRAGVAFLARAWPGSGGWPYVITADAVPQSYRPQQIAGMNLLNAESVAYLASHDADADLLRMVEQAIDSMLFFSEPTARGQQLTYALRSGHATLGLFDAACRAVGREPDVLAGTGRSPGLFAGILPVDQPRIRRPDRRVLYLRPTADAAGVRLVRTHTLAGEGAPGSLRLTDAAGRERHAETFAIEDTEQSFEVALPADGEPGAVYRLDIEDARWGIWRVEPAGVDVLVKAGAETMLANVGTARYFVHVPQDTEEIRIRLRGVHTGAYGAALLDEDGGRVLGVFRGVNRGGILVPGVTDGLADDEDTAEGTLAVALDPENTGRVLPLVLWASNTLGIEVEGIPPYLALDPAAWFDPTSAFDRTR